MTINSKQYINGPTSLSKPQNFHSSFVQFQVDVAKKDRRESKGKPIDFELSEVMPYSYLIGSKELSKKGPRE